MDPRGMRPTATAPTPTPSPASELPTDVLLEIAMRAGFVTLLRCGATCKALRRAIHAPYLAYLVPRVCSDRDGVVPTRLLLYLDTGTSSSFSLAHPSTPDAAVFLVDDHLAPFVSRGAADLLAMYHPVTSRGSLVLLERNRGVEEMWMPSSARRRG
ncbi:hypothetical protein HU200_018851 [Digitaria exilis]|uniref:F-box domain-containing protein n=1 Tax=Digitaria exilis TaxID=1010633 RepID=A0A835F528_9POAL|nr:hypothetical protein HU200_018851 [Digitaria exilis]